MSSGCSLVILAGGESRRMGRDKAALPAGQGTLLERLAVRLGPAVDETIVAVRSAAPALEGVRMVVDHFPGVGPLGGMHAGLLAANYPHVWVVGCDLPDIEPALGGFLRGLAAGYEAVVPRLDGEPQGVCALYDRALAPRIEALLEQGRRSINSLLALCTVRYVAAAELRGIDPQLRSFRNLNTPADYEAWRKTQPARR